MEGTICLKIKKYGPLEKGTSELEHGYLRVPEYTFLIGDQGAGKSTIAKVISTFSWIEKALVRKTIEQKSLDMERLATFLNSQNLPKDYLTVDTEIEYRGDAFIITVMKRRISVTVSARSNNYVCPQIMYYPSERNLLTAMDNPWEVRGMPEMVVQLASEYLNAQMSNGRKTRNLFNKYRMDFNPVSKISYIQDPVKGNRIPISYASSGLQSVAPLVVVSDYLTKRVNEDLIHRMRYESIGTRNRILESIMDDDLKAKLSAFFSSYMSENFTPDDMLILDSIARQYVNSTLIQIVEEPEQNLFPSSQVSIARKLIENTNNNGKLVVTTHSPYILSAVNNYIFAYDLDDKIKKYPKGLSRKYFIRYEDVAAYKVVDGKAVNILDDETRMIDVTEIDGCSEEINSLFDALMTIKERADEQK